MKRRQSDRNVRGMIGRAGEACGVVMEAMESRRLLAAVFWDGGAGSSNWNDAANWNRGGVDALPQNGDDVTISVAANPTISYTTGTLTLASLVSDEALTLTGGTLALQPGGTADINAVLQFLGGNIAGGSWDVAGGTLRPTTSGGTITDAAIIGEIVFDATSATLRLAGSTRFNAIRMASNNANIQMTPGYTLSDPITIEGAATGNRVITGAVGGTGSLTIAPTGSIRILAGAGGGLTIQNSSVLTLINNGLLSNETTNRSLGFSNTTLTNNATIQATASGGTLDLTPTNFTNQAAGVVTGAGGSTITIGGAWSNLGTITSNGATVNLGGTFTAVGTFNRTGGTVNLTGTFNNAGTFTFSAATGAWNLSAGSVVGGTVIFSGANRIVPTTSGGNLTDVQITGDIILDTTSAALRVGGTTRFTAIRLAANAVQLQFTPGYTLFDLVSTEGAAAGGRTVSGAVGGTGTLTIAPTGSIRVAAGAGGGLTVQNSNQLTLINNGLISNDSTNRTLSLNNTTVTNNSTIQATASGGTLDLSPTNFSNQATGVVTGAAGAIVTIGGTWSNAGAITSDGATLNLGGTFTSVGSITRTGGVVNLTGTFTNAGTFTFSAATGAWNLSGGGITGGTLVFNGANRLTPTSSGGTLTDVQVTGDLILDTTSASVRVVGSTRFSAVRLSANAVSLQAAPGYTLLDLVSIEGAATGARTITGAVGGTGTLTIGATGIVRIVAGSGGGLNFQNSNVATIINNGLISNESTNRSLAFGNTTFTNNATIQAIGAGGTIDVSPTNFTNQATGVVSGASGSIVTIGGTWSNLGTITSNGATVNLGGTFNAIGTFTRIGGTVNLTGTFNNPGTFTFNAASGSWNFLGGGVTGGAIVFSAGERLIPTSSGGNLTDVQVTGDLVHDTTSASVRIVGTTRFTAVRLAANAANVQFAPGYTLLDLVSIEGATTGARQITGAVGGVGTFTIGATGIVRLAAGSGGNVSFQNSNAATIINNGLISNESTNRTLSFNNTTLTNNALIQATTGAGVLDITPTNFTNSTGATLSGAAGTTITIGGNWTNAGTITINGATLNLGGTFTLATAGAITRTGGTVNLTGTLTNTATTFTFTPATGPWNLVGGTINGGSVIFNGSDRLVLTVSGGGLTDVQVTGELILDTTSASVRVGGTTRFTAARLAANAASLQAAPGYTLLDLVVVEGAVTGARTITGAVGGTGTLTIGPSAVIRVTAGSGGNLSFQNSNQATIINDGLIINESTNRTISFNNTTVTNNATIRASAAGGALDISPTNFTNAAGGNVIGDAGTTVSFAGTWSNAGTITSNGATVNLGGAFTLAGLVVNRTGGIVNLTGTANNASNTFTFTPATGAWNLSGGTINGGTIVFNGANRLTTTSSAGTLNDVQVNGELIMETTSAAVRVAGSTRFTAARLTGNASNIQFAPGYTLFDLVSAEGAVAGTRSVIGAVGGTGTFTIAPSGVIRLAPGAGGNLTFNNSNQVTFTNNGTIAAEANGRTLDLNFTTYTNIANNTLTGGTWIATGTSALTFSTFPATVITTNNANVTVGGSTTNGGATSFPALATLAVNNGSLSTGGGGTFTITPAGGTLQNNGTITLTPANTLAVTGNFTMAPTAIFTTLVRQDLPADIGRLTVTGTATLTGTLNVVPTDGWQPECINSIFIDPGTLIGQFTTQNLPTPPGMHTTFVVYLGEVRFAISPPSDYNRDGFLNSQDFFDYLNAFFALDPSADFNNDGFLNSQDFFDFINDFFMGCP